MEEFPVLQLDQGMLHSREVLGLREKSWMILPSQSGEELWLFKEPRLEPGKMEHLAEKIAQEVADCIGLPCARVELATLDGKRGSISKNVLRAGETLIHGNEVIAGLVDGYDPKAKRGSRDHTFDRACLGISGYCQRNDQAAIAQFAGFLTLDALIGNTDRHHLNWAVINSTPPRLAPSFDHASSLGRELEDKRRHQILSRSGMADYLQRGEGQVFLKDQPKAVSPIGLVTVLRAQFPALFDPWLMALEGVTEDRLDRIMRRLPKDWVSERQLAFAKSVVLESKRILCGLR